VTLRVDFVFSGNVTLVGATGVSEALRFEA